jgi:cell volume regulation protein A
MFHELQIFENPEAILLVASIIFFFSIIAGKAGFRFGLPALLLFLGVGMLFGSDGLGIQFSNPSAAQFIGMLALSIILFSGGMDTKMSEIKPIATEGVVLATVGVLLTTLITGGFIYYVFLWSTGYETLTVAESMLMAAVMSSTDSASVFNLLRSQRMNLKQNLRPMLELESGSNDPMAYMLTIVLIQVISSGSNPDFLLITKDLLVQFFFGGVIGYAMGRFSVWLINRINLSNSSLYSILLLSLVFITFTITDQLKGNAYLAVYIMGVILGNTRLAYRKEINTFMSGLTWLFQIIMFLTLGLLVNPHEMLDIAAVALLIGVFMILVARPLSIFLCLLPFRNITNKGRLFVSWVGLRGATPIIFATYPVLAQIEGSQQLFNIVFFITLLSLVIQGMTITKAAKILQLDLPAPKEGNEFGVELPEEIDTRLNDLTLTAEMLEDKNRLAEMQIPKGTLVMLVKRGNEFLIPNGQMELKPGDKLLLISENKNKSAD